MYLPDNLYYLRKRDRVTQEELADKLGVSRQAVSKWETGEAYPETDKLLLLCDMFDVSLDALMRSDLKLVSADPDSAPAMKADGEKPDEPDSVKEEAKAPETKAYRASEIGYDAHVNGFARAIAAGVFLILLGIAVCLIMCALGSVYADAKSLFEILGGTAVVLFAVPAVFLFVLNGLSHDRFLKSYPVIKSDYSPEDVAAFSKKFSVAMACLVSGIILDVVLLIVFCALTDEGVIFASNKEAATCFIAAAFFVLLGFIVGGIVLTGIKKSKYDVNPDNTVRDPASEHGKKSKVVEAIDSIIMISCVAIYLLLGFVFALWHPGWIVFPVGALACAVVNAVGNAINKSDD